MRVIIAGGGTGGHLFPGVAIAEEIKRRDAGAEVLFVGTQRGIEARVLPAAGWALATIDVSGIKTKGVWGALRGLLSVPRALWQSRRILKSFRPDVVVGVGGYASGPLVLMAWLRRIPTAILEQNSVPGMANKILGKVVKVVFISFEETRRFFQAKKVAMTGTPIRTQLRERLEAAQDAGGDGGGTVRVFCFGGSQGARAVSHMMVDAAVKLKAAGLDFSLVHQTGPADEEAIRERYQEAGVEADVRAFIDDMAAEYGRADLIVSRSGAGTVSEITAVGRPAILIPYPFAAYDHQRINARELAESGAALVFGQEEIDGERLAGAILALARDPDRRRKMAAAMRALGRPDAAARIVDWIAERVTQ